MDIDLSADQRQRLTEAMSEVPADQRPALVAMAQLRNMEAGWQADRLWTIHYAAHAVDADLLSMDHVLKALDISRATWTRRRAELREWLAGRGGVAATAAGDQAEAAAQDINIDGEN